jgi:hypothetical protein
VVLSALVVAGFLGCVALTLLSLATPSWKPLVEEKPGMSVGAVALLPADSRPGERVFRLQLSSTRPGELLEYDQIRLVMATYRTHPRLIRGTLRVSGTPCELVTTSGAVLMDNRHLTFTRGDGCDGVATTAKPVTLELALRMRGSGRVGVWTLTSPKDLSGAATLMLAGPAGQPEKAAVRGFLANTESPSTARKITLLNHMWQLSDSVQWIWLVVLLAGLLVFAAGLCLPVAAAPAVGRRLARFRHAARATASATLVALALGLLYTVLVPPMMAPDEPYHLAGFGAINGGVPSLAQIRDWSKTTHLARIRFNPDQRFRTDDIRSALPPADPSITPTATEQRSAVVTTLWRGLGRLWGPQSAPQALLLLRLAHACVFALGVGISALVLSLLARVRFAALLPLALLAVPTLPFFAMHVSDHAILAAIYPVVAASVATLLLGGPAAHWAALPLGLASGLMVASGRGSWPLLAVIAFVLVARLAFGIWQSGRSWLAACTFLGGIAVGVAVFMMIRTPGFDPFFLLRKRKLPDPMVHIKDRLSILLALPLALALVGLGLDWLRSRLRRTTTGRSGRFSRLAAGAGVVLLLLGCVATAWIEPPQLESLTRASPSGWSAQLVAGAPTLEQYVKNVMLSMATMFRFGRPDFYTFSSFWGGFGWLDTILPDELLLCFSFLVLAGLVTLLLWIARQRSVTLLGWLLTLGVGWAVSLAAYAAVCHYVPVNLHGRYLIGWWLTLLAVVWSPITFGRSDWTGEPPDESQPSSARIRTTIVFVLIPAIHAYCLRFILLRYF